MCSEQLKYSLVAKGKKERICFDLTGEAGGAGISRSEKHMACVYMTMSINDHVYAVTSILLPPLTQRKSNYVIYDAGTSLPGSVHARFI